MTFLSILAVGLILVVLHNVLTVFAAAMKIALLKAAFADTASKLQGTMNAMNATSVEHGSNIREVLQRQQRRNLFEKN